jgi:serine acetyltransferase
LVAFLRTHSVTIECGTTSVVLEPDPAKSIIVSSPANAPEREVTIPRQRSQQQKQRRGIV